MIERNDIELLKLCSLLEQRRKAEIAYQRAMWRVSYYRKIKARLDEKSSFSSKWTNNSIELTKKIESARIISLKKNSDFIKVKQKLRKRIATACEKAWARLMFQNGKIIGLMVTKDDHSTYMISESEFKEKAAQYDAIAAMNKVLLAP